MICPECGERYNFYEPKCPWCGAPKPNPEKKPEEELSAAKIEQAEEKETFFVYKTQRKHDGKFKIVCNYFFSVTSFLFFVLIGGIILEDSLSASNLYFVFTLFMASFIIFFHAFYSSNVVREIRCHEDEFVLYSCFDKTVLSFKKVDLQKKKIDWFDRQVLLFRKNEGIFLVDSKDFPEVVETMMKLYFE